MTSHRWLLDSRSDTRAVIFQAMPRKQCAGCLKWGKNRCQCGGKTTTLKKAKKDTDNKQTDKNMPVSSSSQITTTKDSDKIVDKIALQVSLEELKIERLRLEAEKKQQKLQNNQHKQVNNADGRSWWYRTGPNPKEWHQRSWCKNTRKTWASHEEYMSEQNDGAN